MGSRQSGVYAWVVGVAGAEPGRRAHQLVALTGLEIGAQPLLDADGEPDGLVQKPASARRKDHRTNPRRRLARFVLAAQDEHRELTGGFGLVCAEGGILCDQLRPQLSAGGIR